MSELADLIRTELGVEDDSYYASPGSMRKAIEALLVLHRQVPMYGECEHTFEQHEAGNTDVVYAEEIGETCEAGRTGDICFGCCCSYELPYSQTEQCADYHGEGRGTCYPCPTVRAVAQQLGLLAEVDHDDTD